jgi:hypothetical protein
LCHWHDDLLDACTAFEENGIHGLLIFSPEAEKRDVVPHRQPCQQLGSRLAAVAGV